MRILVTGKHGQLVSSLAAAAGAAHRIETIGRPELDLQDPDGTFSAIIEAAPDIVVSAAAFTAVDRAEGAPEEAFKVNAEGAAAAARAAERLGVPIIHISTDYVFDGEKSSPYVETDITNPRSVYGASKLAGEQGVMAATGRHVILRTAWVYSPFGKNFLKTMLSLAEQRSELSVVADQYGNPSYAPDLARGILAIADRMSSPPSNPYGVFHMAGSGETAWAGFATAIFDESRRRGGPFATVKPIPASAYPSPAPRPANSRLDCQKLALTYGVKMPDWVSGVKRCLDQIMGL